MKLLNFNGSLLLFRYEKNRLVEFPNFLRLSISDEGLKTGDGNE